jgi:hypothetical protein
MLNEKLSGQHGGEKCHTDVQGGRFGRGELKESPP